MHYLGGQSEAALSVVRLKDYLGPSTLDLQTPENNNETILVTGGQATSATITLKSIPNDIYERLKEVTELHHRSLNMEVIACLERTLHRDIAAYMWMAQDAERSLRDNFRTADRKQEKRAERGRSRRRNRGPGTEDN